MENYRLLHLQLFAGEGGTEGAQTGDNAAVDAEQRLRELGVPEDKLHRRANKNAAKPTEGAVKTANEVSGQQEEQKDAASDTPTEEQSANSRMSWDDIMKDPEYNKQMQAVMQARLKSSKQAEESLSKLTPALEILARKYGLDAENIDHDALAKAISDDNTFYEDRALEMGVPLETAKKIDMQERNSARAQREEAMNLEQQKIRDHLASLEAQGKALKETFPTFDLKTELRNPVFARMTSPSGGISVEDAYYAIHRKELQTAAMQVTAEKTAERIAKSIQAGNRRPNENGASAKASSVTAFNYRSASPEQRSALKKAIRDAAARGEKIYPSTFK